MRLRKSSELPRQMAHAVTRFADWRRSHEPGTRVPESLWTAAVKLATHYGVSRTAVALKLNYGGLKRRVEARGAEAKLRRASHTPAFVELAGPMLETSGECVIELQNTAGSTMRIQIKGSYCPDLVALGTAFYKLKR